jgi:DNA-binding transcriptional regulator YdaS (Cro superfamily)
MTPQEALKEAIEIIGGGSALARELGLTPPAITHWDQCPAKYAVKVEALIQKVALRANIGPTRHELAPDFFPRNPPKET